MLLEHEKSGVGPRRIARASAFLEAASFLDAMAETATPSPRMRHTLEAAADVMRDKAVQERKAHDKEFAGREGNGAGACASSRTGTIAVMNGIEGTPEPCDSNV